MSKYLSAWQVIVSLCCNVVTYPVTDVYIEKVLTVVSGVAVICRAALNRSEVSCVNDVGMTCNVQPLVYSLLIL